MDEKKYKTVHTHVYYYTRHVQDSENMKKFGTFSIILC